MEMKEEILTLLNKYFSESTDTEGAMCTNYILISEYVNGDGEYYSLAIKDESIPIWRHKGLLYHIYETEFNDLDEEGE